MKRDTPIPVFSTLVPLCVLAVLAAVIRIPCLHLVPHWSAGNENSLALEILEGARPLTNQNPHLGALSPYIIALTFLITGINPWAPRLVPFFAGIATVLLTWRLGVLTGSRRSGFIAGVLMSAAWYHVVFTSHFPWSNSLTPFFATAFLLVLHHLTRPRSRPLSAQQYAILALAAGLLFGLGMQTHPEMITLLPAVLLLLVIRARHAVRWLRSGTPWLMLIGGITGYGNMIWYNSVHRFRTVSYGLTQPEYALTQEYTATSVAGNYLREFLYLPRIILGFYDDAIPWREYAGYSVLWLFWFLVLAGTVICLQRKQYSVPAAFWSMFLIIPVINSNYTLHLGRYLVFMFPPALILVSETLNRGLYTTMPGRFAGIPKLLSVAVLSLLFLLPVHRIRLFYSECETSGRTRERYFHLANLLSTSTLQKPLVLVDVDTGETYEFLHFLRECRYVCHPVRFREAKRQGGSLNEFVARAVKTDKNEEHDGIILIISPATRRYVLCRNSITAFLGQIDARAGDLIADFYRVYQIDQ